MTIKKIISAILSSGIQYLDIRSIGGGYSGGENQNNQSSEKERYYELLLSNLPDMAYRCRNDYQWTMEFVSKGCYDLTGYNASDLIDNRKAAFNDLILDEYRDDLWEKWQSLLKERKFFEGEYQIRTASGEIKWVWEKGCGVFDDNDNLLALEGFITDITEKKQSAFAKIKVEETHRELQKNLYGIVESIDQCIILIDLHQNVLIANSKSSKVFYANFNFHIELNMKLDFSGLDVIFPEFSKSYKKCLQKQSSVVCRYCHPLTNGSEIWLKWEFNPVLDDGTAHAVCININDISHNQTINNEISRDRALLRVVLDNIPIAVYAKDTDGRKILTNKHDLMHMNAMNETDVLGKTDADFYDVENSRLFMEDDRKVIEEGISLMHREEIRLQPDGSERIILTSKVPLHDADNQIIGLVGIGQDVTETRNINLALEQSEASFHKLVDSAPFAVSIYTFEGVLLYANARSLKMYQCSIEDVMEKQVATKFWVTPDLRIQWVEQLKKDGMVTDFEMHMQNFAGTRKYWVLTSGAVLHYKNQKVIFASHHDVTDKNETLDRLMKSENLLKELNYSKDRFFSIIAHDLKSPFNAILGFSELLFHEYEEFSDEERKRYIKNIFEASDNTFRLIQNLLDWSRLQLDHIHIEHDRLDLSVYVNDAILLHRHLADSKSIRLISDVPFNTIVVGDENIVKTILRNLISNAIKFSHPGSSVFIQAKPDNNADRVIVSVKDDGIGMTSEEISALFRIDMKVLKIGTRDEKGTGLGLLLCHDFIKRLNGEIWVESVDGKGSTFSFFLPSR